MTDPLARHRNPDGTYNGAAMLSELSGLSEAEIRWTFDRMKQLFAEGRTKAETKAIVKREAKARPWEPSR